MDRGPVAIASLSTTLESARLVLRPPRASDVGAILTALRRNEAHLRPYTPQRPNDRGDRRPTLASVARDVTIVRRAWRRDDSYTFFLFDREDLRRVLGRVTLGRVIRGPFQNAFLGYWVDVGTQGKGIMTEAVQAVIGYGFETLALHRVQAGVMPRNVASIRVVEKLGFRNEGLAARYLQIAGKWEDHVIYALTREEWSR